MGKLFWFNPENDLALASNSPHYTPPNAVIKLRRGGAGIFSLWMDTSNDAIITDTVFPCPEHYDAMEAEPWGWSPYALEYFKTHAPWTKLPSPSHIEIWRNLSHRRTALAINHMLQVPEHLCGVEAFTPAQANMAIESFGADAVIKMPWSSSGRGVMATRPMSSAMLSRTITGIIAHQGSVIVEPRLDKVADFGMLYHADTDGTITFRGISLFHTDGRGNYAGNIIASQSHLLSRLDLDITGLSCILTHALTNTYGGKYTGWLGVDLIKLRNGGISPVLEVNMRYTMGVAALLAHDASRLSWDTSILRYINASEAIPTEAVLLGDTASRPSGFPLLAVIPQQGI